MLPVQDNTNVWEGTFGSLLEQVASKYRADIQVAVNALSIENGVLRTRLAGLQAQLAEQCGSEREVQAGNSRNVGDAGNTGDARKAAPEAGLMCPPSATPLTARHASVKDGVQLASPAAAPRDRTRHRPSERMDSKGSSFVVGATLYDRCGFRPTSTGTKGSRDVVERKMSEISRHESTKLLRRLQRILYPGGQGDMRSQPLCPAKLLDVLSKKGHRSLTLESVKELLEELQAAAVIVLPAERFPSTQQFPSLDDECSKTCISLEVLVSMFMMPDPGQIFGEQTAARLNDLRSHLLAEDAYETIERLSSLTDMDPENAQSLTLVERLRQINRARTDKMPPVLGKWLHAVVAFCVLASIVLIGVSLDNNPEHPAWLCIECSFACVFVVEVALKLYYNGWHEFFSGPEYAFNMLDLVVAVISIVDASLEVFFYASQARALGMVAILKGLRLFRFARLLKLFNQSPMLKNLGSMMCSFVVSAPFLLWVMVFILMFVYLMAICFRTFFVVENSGHGVSPEDMMDRCGHGDFVELDLHGAPVDPDCVLYVLYGEEFFGTVPRSMITVFRLMIGNTDTTSGKSLVQLLDTTRATDHDGGQINAQLPFYFFYIPFMIIVMFGMFNIITSIFVESTINGLKRSELQIRRRRHYESHHVHDKLEQLVGHIRDLMGNEACGSEEEADLCIDSPTFHELMKNNTVRDILNDLDVDFDETTCHFDMFDLEGIGQIPLTHFLNTLMRLRGETQKIDFVSSWSTLRALQTHFQEFEQVALAMLQELTIEQGNLNQRFDGADGSIPVTVPREEELELTRAKLRSFMSISRQIGG